MAFSQLRITLASLACVVVTSSGLPADYFDAFDRVLKRQVKANDSKDGISLHSVDYCSLLTDPDFVPFIQSLDQADTRHLTRKETMALYINAYNALALKMIIDHRSYNGSCITSIRDIFKAKNGSVEVWNQPAGSVAGKTMSLQDIEDTLTTGAGRLFFVEDCRVHGALVCASVSCPNLRQEAYRADTLDAQLDANVQDWLSNPAKGSSVQKVGFPGRYKLTVSEIFSFYPKQFKSCSGSIVRFLQRYAPAQVTSLIHTYNFTDANLTFFDYDWDLNGVPPCNCTPPNLMYT